MNGLGLILRGTVLGALALGLTHTVHPQEAAPDELVRLVIKLLADADQDMRALALEQIRTQAAGEAATEQFAAQLVELPPDRQIELLRALTDRGDRTARPAIVRLLAESDNEPARVAAIRALGFLGEVSDVSTLLTALATGSRSASDAARKSLVSLPGESVPGALVDALQTDDPSARVVLIEILAERRSFETVGPLLPLAEDADPRVRGAAMSALGQLAGPAHVPGMIRGVLAAQSGREREKAEKAVAQLCGRIRDREQQAQPLVAAMEALPPADQYAALPTLGRVGGPTAREVVLAAIASRDRERHHAGVRALCNWPNASVAPELVELTTTETHAGDRIAALRALIRVAVVPDGRSEKEKLQLLQRALPLCTRDAECNLVLQRAQAVRIPETLTFLLPYLEQPVFAQRACESIVELAHHRSLRNAHQAEFHAALDRVIEVATDDTVLERARRYRKGQTWVRPK